MFDKYIFSSRLKELRTKAGITQSNLGDAVGIRKSAICMVESGERAVSLEVAYALADYFDVSLDYLVGRSDDPTRK